MIVYFVNIIEVNADTFFQVNSVKDLRILLEEDGLTSHYGDNKMSAAEEQPLNPTAKEHSLAEKSCPQVGETPYFFNFRLDVLIIQSSRLCKCNSFPSPVSPTSLADSAVLCRT